ncbi:MAG TPA: diguanylate cyclase [Clostridia bacterium]|nr:diguanylate cyclase [Clostridia bacterium]
MENDSSALIKKYSPFFYLLLGGFLLMHCIYVVYFYYVGSRFMSLFNVFSVVFYLLMLGVFLLKKTADVINFSIIEICIQAFFAALTLGTGNGFELFLICTVFGSYHLASAMQGKKYIAYMTTGFAFILLMCLRFLPYYIDMTPIRIYPDSLYLDFIFVLNSFAAFTIVSILIYIFFSSITRDKEKLKLQNDHLSELASKDSLTQLLNRRAMKQRLEVADDRKQNQNVEFVIAIVDIDDFKQINDHYGHDCGDMVLKSVVGVIKENVRETDYVSRWGGDEILILFNKSSLSGVVSCVERIHNEIENNRFEYNNEALVVTITAGICQSDNYFMYQDVILEADRRLYDGKHRGKNRIVYETVSI